MDNIFSPAVPIERITGFLPSITTDHAYIHDGRAFRASWVSNSIAAGAVEYASITTSPSLFTHMRPASFASTANLLEVTIMGNATVSGGIVISNINQNLNVNTISEAIVKKNVDITTSGNITIGLYGIGSGGAPSAPKGAGSAGADNEIVLKKNTTYTIALKNNGSVTATLAYSTLFWYEEDKGV